MTLPRFPSLACALAAALVLASTTLPATASGKAKKPAKKPAQVWVLGNILPVGTVNDQFAHGFSQQASSNGVNVGADFPLLGQRLLLVWQYYDIVYNHKAGDVPNIGGGSSYVGAFVNQQYTLEERAGVQVPTTPLYLGLAIYYHPNQAGLPVLVGGGFGVEKPPETKKQQWGFGRLYYYPYVLNEVPYTPGYQYSILRYEAGYGRNLGRLGRSRILGTIGIAGDHATAVVNAPTNVDITSLEIGVGFGF